MQTISRSVAGSPCVGSRRLGLLVLAAGLALSAGQALAQPTSIATTHTATTSTGAMQPEGVKEPVAGRRAPVMLDDVPEELRNADWFTPRSQRNGALAYYKSFVKIASRDFRAKMNEVDWDAVGTITDRAKMPESYLAAEALLSSDHIEAVREAAMMTHCNWEAPYEFGISTLLPYLGDMRATGRTMRVAVRQGMLEGKPRVAADRFDALVGVARDAARDPVLICSLVGIAIANLASDEAKKLAESGQLTEAARTRMIASLESINTEDFMGTRRAVLGERDVFLGWVERTFDGPDGAVAFVKMLEEESDATEMLAIKALSEEQFKQGLENLRRYYNETIKLWDGPEAVERLTEAEAAMKRGDYGPLGSVLAPSLIKARISQARAKQGLQDAIDALREAKVRDAK